MRAGYVILLVVVAFLLGAALRTHAQGEQSGPIGRYYILSSPYTIWFPNGTGQDERSVFRIDTATGRTWLYHTGKGPGNKPVNAWFPIDE
jgi:hypothetical protein